MVVSIREREEPHSIQLELLREKDGLSQLLFQTRWSVLLEARRSACILSDSLELPRVKRGFKAQVQEILTGSKHILGYVTVSSDFSSLPLNVVATQMEAGKQAFEAIYQNLYSYAISVLRPEFGQYTDNLNMFVGDRTRRVMTLYTGSTEAGIQEELMKDIFLKGRLKMKALKGMECVSKAGNVIETEDGVNSLLAKDFQSLWDVLTAARRARNTLGTVTTLVIAPHSKHQITETLEDSRHIIGKSVSAEALTELPVEIARKIVTAGIQAHTVIYQKLCNSLFSQLKDAFGDRAETLEPLVKVSALQVIKEFQGTTETQLHQDFRDLVKHVGEAQIQEIKETVPFAEQMLAKYEKMLWKLASEAASSLQGCGFTLKDTYDSAVVLMLAAWKKYDPVRSKFSTYATLRIRNGLKDIARSQGTQRRDEARDRKFIDTFTNEFTAAEGRLPTLHEISEGTELDHARIEEIENPVTLVPFDAGVRDEDGEPASLEELLPDPSPHFMPEEVLVVNEMRLQVQKAVSLLPEREQYIIKMFYTGESTLEGISKVMGISASRVCQLHKEALVRLKLLMEASE